MQIVSMSSRGFRHCVFHKVRFPAVRILGWVAGLAYLLGSQWLMASPPNLKDLEIAPGLGIQLYASEPDVVDPVALSFDEQGRCYVVEMRDYPLGIGPEHRPGGTVRLLEDRDHDGRIDRSVVFATGLSFPTSVMAWSGGILVLAPPELLFLKDTDGDGIADVRRVIATGFKLGVTDSNANGLRWGLEHQIHMLNGGNGGRIAAPGAVGTGLDLQECDVSWDPRKDAWTRTFVTSGGFGSALDDWGHRFCTYNINHIQHQWLAVRYVEHAVGLPTVSPTLSISDHEEMARVFPISVPETRVNHPEQAGHFSSAGGMGRISIPGYPGDLSGSVVVGDVVGNLMHRDLILEEGPGFKAVRAPGEQAREFFASRDLACRPTGLELGPDGALYLLDMQRDVIEHPDYIPEKTKARLDLRAGSDRGRIYRIAPMASFQNGGIQTANFKATDWIPYLAHSNAWWRTTAQRLILEKPDPTLIPAIRRFFVHEKSALGKLHALWALHGLGAVTEADLELAFRQNIPGLIENALLISETVPRWSVRFHKEILGLLDHPHARVRFQSALTLGLRGEVDEMGMEALFRLWRRDVRWQQSRIAVLTAVGGHVLELVNEVVSPGMLNGLSEAESRQALSELAYTAGRQFEPSHWGKFAQLVDRLRSIGSGSEWRTVIFEAFDEGYRVEPRAGAAPENVRVALERCVGRDPDAMKALLRLMRDFRMSTDVWKASMESEAAQRLQNSALPEEEKVRWVHFFELSELRTSQPFLLELLRSEQGLEVQRAALSVLARHAESEVGQGILEHWRGIHPRLRSEAIQALVSRQTWHAPLLKALDQGRVTVGELNLDLEQRRKMLRDASEVNREHAKRFFGDEEYSNRKKVVEEWLGKLPATGSASRGQEVFQRVCSPCHRMGELGHAVGPNLSDQSHRSVEDLVSNILDPSMAVNPSFTTVNCDTRDGESVSGILDSQTADRVILRQPQGIQRSLLRRDILKMEFTGASLMPEGLENAMTPQELRDVVDWIQHGSTVK